MTEEASEQREYDEIEMTAEMVAAYVAHNSVPTAELPALIQTVHQALTALGRAPAAEVATEPLKPAVPIRKSVTDDFIICLADGKRYKSLKRHLMMAYGMSPQQYREKWRLPRDYPMVAPSYAKSRSALAKAMGLGAQRRKNPRGAVASQKKRATTSGS